jgi:hypothetical protein
MLLWLAPIWGWLTPLAVYLGFGNRRDDERSYQAHIAGSLHYASSGFAARMPELARAASDEDTVVFHCALSQVSDPPPSLPLNSITFIQNTWTEQRTSPQILSLIAQGIIHVFVAPTVVWSAVEENWLFAYPTVIWVYFRYHHITKFLSQWRLCDCILFSCLFIRLAYALCSLLAAFVVLQPRWIWIFLKKMLYIWLICTISSYDKDLMVWKLNEPLPMLINMWNLWLYNKVVQIGCMYSSTKLFWDMLR